MSYTIKELPDEEKPRERAKKYGFESLTNAELIALLLGSGTKEKNVKELAIEVLNFMEEYHGLQNSRLNNLLKIKGIKEAKALTLLAALELGNRYAMPKNETKIKIKEAKDAYWAFAKMLNKTNQEKFLVIFLNHQNVVITSKVMFVGTLKEAVIEPREIIKEAIMVSASKLLIMHNHPGGNPTPSKEDEKITQKIEQEAKYFDIPLLDHIIVSQDTFYSFYSQQKSEVGR